jgi:2-C-methyl-D-erythritol 4-phosphate cytidylyltransferase
LFLKGNESFIFGRNGGADVRVGVIVCAAGQGKRMGLGRNKQFLELQGKPLLIHTLHQWEKSSVIKEITVVVGPGEVEKVQELIRGEQWSKAYTVVVGGNERQESVYQGLLSLTTHSYPDIVLIHDGARPFFALQEIERLIESARLHGAAVLAVPMKDTIKRVTGEGRIEETLDRSKLWAIQTPQAFTYSLIMQAHQWAREEGILATDDASLVEKLNKPVYIVQGSYNNIKLTTPEDIDLAEFLLQRRRKE